MTDPLTLHLRILRPAPGILAFYDGRVEGYRFAPGPNWVDDGALSLGIDRESLSALPLRPPRPPPQRR